MTVSIIPKKETKCLQTHRRHIIINLFRRRSLLYAPGLWSKILQEGISNFFFTLAAAFINTTIFYKELL